MIKNNEKINFIKHFFFWPFSKINFHLSILPLIEKNSIFNNDSLSFLQKNKKNESIKYFNLKNEFK